MLFSFDESGVPEKDAAQLSAGLDSYVSRLLALSKECSYADHESAICFPGDDAFYKEILSVYQDKIEENLRYVVVIGIGGSNLGTKAVYDAVLGYKDILRDDTRPQMLFLDANDEENTRALIKHILKNVRHADELLVVVASKSGVTIETIAHLEYFLAALQNKISGISERMVIITDKNSPLWNAAEARGLTTLSVPKPVGGRYSVFSAVGILPLMAAGINTAALNEGALSMRDKCVYPGEDNPAVKSAVFLSYWRMRGKTIHDAFFFEPELESLGKWYRQLLAESIGKSEEVGITPTVSVGSTDLHSVGQLYLGGPKDKTTMFVENDKPEHIMRLPDKRIFPELSPFLDGKSFSNIKSAIVEGVKTAYRKRGLPLIEAHFEGIKERELGGFIMWKMIEVMCLGQIFSVNAFDQPDVEKYKSETERILSGKNT